MSDTSESKNPFNKWWFISGGLVLVIAAALVWILVVGPGSASNNDALPEAPATSSALPEQPTSSSKPTELAGGECDLDDGDQEIPTVGPEAEWVQYGPMQVPTSDEIGPAVVNGPVWECFAHTPTGALFFAAYTSTALSWNDYEAVAKANVVESPAVDAFLVDRSDDPEVTVKPGTAPGIGGFRFESYEGDKATVQVGVRYGENERMLRVYLVWDDESSDWKVDLSKGDPTIVTNEVTSLQNFTQWGPTYE